MTVCRSVLRACDVVCRRTSLQHGGVLRGFNYFACKGGGGRKGGLVDQGDAANTRMRAHTHT
jgi:hypothetical protein